MRTYAVIMVALALFGVVAGARLTDATNVCNSLHMERDAGCIVTTALRG